MPGDHLLTVVIETDDGSPLDVERLRAVLREAGFSANSWVPGDHLMGEVALGQAAETLELALRMVQGLRVDDAVAKAWRDDPPRRPAPGFPLPPGLYRIRWADGGTSVASVGVTAGGGRWLAPTNWVAPADPFDRWDMIASAERLDGPGGER